MIFRKAILSILGVSTFTACGGKSSTTADTAATTTTTTTTVASDVTSLKDLSLAGVLAITLPDSVKGSGTEAGLKLAGTSKSFEACKLRQELKEGLSNIAQVASTFCMLESDPNITFGKKYNIDFSAMSGGGAGGDAPSGDFDPSSIPAPPGLRLSDGPSFPSSVQIWIDNSTTGKLTVYMCQDKKLSQLIEVTGAKDGVAKGKVIMKQEMSFGDFSMNFHRAMNFDNKYSDSEITSITVKELINTSSTSFGSEKARRLLGLSLSDTGVSKVLSSFSGDYQGSSNSFASVGAFDSDFGSVIAKGSATDPSDPSTPFEFSSESFFDGKSYNVDPDAYPAAFGTNGKVVLKPESVPGFLGASFSPEDFPSTAWDCSGTEDLTMDMSSSGESGSECTETWAELSTENCFDSGFAEGPAITIDESQQVDASEFEGFDESDTAAELRK